MYRSICFIILFCFSTPIFAEQIIVRSENKLLESDVTLTLNNDVNLPEKIIIPAHQNVDKLLSFSLPQQITLSIKRTDERSLPSSCNEKTFEYITLLGAIVSFNVISSTESCQFVVLRKDKNGQIMQTFA